MSYLAFLFIFLVPPILLLGWLAWRDRRAGVILPSELRNWPVWAALSAHVLVALLYTTPWDNYLVASRVWWYDPALVTGILLGWVPLEEYIFFVLQPLLTGLWLLFLARRLVMPPQASPRPPRLNLISTLLAGVIWIGAVIILLTGWRPGTYLALELAWAIPPIMVQLSFGADILWRQRRLVLLTLLPVTLYLSLADALAIGAGTWTINPALSLEIYLGGVLPLEELLFFLLTNMLLTFGIILVLARQSQRRINAFLKHRSFGVAPFLSLQSGGRNR
jgi:lycopene cyclase domain-containing protein